MLKNSNPQPQLIEAHKRVIPIIGDFIMYQGRLAEVVKIKHFKQCLIIESDRSEIILPLKVGYSTFGFTPYTPLQRERVR
jgi:hypothetical protein